MDLKPEQVYCPWTENFDIWFAKKRTVIMKADVNPVFFLKPNLKGKDIHIMVAS